MAFSDVTAVTKHFSQANEGFTATLGSSIAASAVTMPLSSVAGLDDGSVFVGIIEPGGAKEQAFMGTVDAGGVQLTGVVWTKGSNVPHSLGVTIVDYVTGAAHNMMTKGILVAHNQDGTLKTNVQLTSPKVITSLNDTNNNELIKVTPTSSAVNELTIANAATGNAPTLSATGDDTNIGMSFGVKGTGTITGVVENMKNPYAFRVYRNSAWTAGTGANKVQFDSEDFDTGSDFDSTTNNRFIAPVAGFYSFTATVTVSVGAGDFYGVLLRKNGSTIANGQGFVTYFAFNSMFVVTTELQLAATDYIEVFFNNGSGSSRTGITGTSNTYFSGRMISKA